MLRQLTSPKENCQEIVSLFLKELSVKVTDTTLENALISHPDYPSLLSISDVLSDYGVTNVSFKANFEKLEKTPTPFITQIKGEEGQESFYTITRSFTSNGLSYYNPERHRWEDIGKENFEKKWQGIVLLADVEEKRDEENYIKKYREEARLKAAKYVTYLSLPLIAIIESISALVNYSTSAIYPVLFSLFSLAGSVIGSLLLWYDVDQYNPVLQQICSSGKKVNCGAILHSKAAKIAGISWSNIGFTYFAGGLFVLLFTGIVHPQALFVLAWLNVLAIPYVFFSLYYQWRIARQWCVLCLCVQGLLVLQLLTALTAGWYQAVPVSSIFSNKLIITIILSYSIPFFIVSLLMPAYRSAKESRRNKIELQRLKHNPQIFSALLAKQKAVTENPEGLGITIGNPYASNKIIKVCNPYCSPCAKAHTPIEELVHNNDDVQVQIIFTVTDDNKDKRAAPVKHLLAIAEKENEALIKQALDSWYLAEQKDYEKFASKYPMNGELQRQGEKLEAMSTWCNKNEIIFTPTFFVNGNQLPEMYTVNDLKYFLSK